MYSELIGRYREKGQECACLQEQLRQSQSQEASLKQGMVGLKAEMQALVEENSGLQEALVTHHCEREVIMARATNAEVNSLCMCTCGIVSLILCCSCWYGS